VIQIRSDSIKKINYNESKTYRLIFLKLITMQL